MKNPPKGIIETLADGGGFAWLYATVGKRLDSLSRFITHVLAAPFFFLVPVKRNKIVFRSGINFYGGELRPLVVELLRFDEHYEMIWLVNASAKPKDLKAFPYQIRLTKARSFRALFDLYTARVVVDTEPHGHLLLKKHNQFYIQTSNNSMPLQYRLHNFTTKQLQGNAKMPDICIAGNAFETAEYQEKYGNTPTILNLGHPRNKALLRLREGSFSHKNDRNAIAKRFGFEYELKKANIALFVAPELRVYQDFDRISQALKTRFGGSWIVLVVSSLPKFVFRGNIHDVQSYQNRHKIMVAADVLITDGTGWTLDYLLSGRPTFLFNIGEDEETIKNCGRKRFQGLGLDTAHSLDTLEENILAFDRATYQHALKIFLSEHSFTCNDFSALRIAEIVRLLCQPGISMREIYSRELNIGTLSAQRKLHPGILKGFCIGFAEGWLCSWLYKTAGRYLDKLLRQCLTSVIGFFYWKLPIQRDKIVFWMCHQKYGGNSKYLTEEILRQNLPYDLVWVSRYSANPGLVDFPDKVRVINEGSLRAQKEIATAKVWVDDTIRKGLERKRNGQHFIQTWHGSLGLKRFEMAWDDTMRDVTNRITDICISNSSFETNDVYRASFWEKTDIREFGHPRNDIFFWEVERIQSVKDKVFTHFAIPKHKKLILYAPTFRQIHFHQKNFTQSMFDCYKLPVSSLLRGLENKFQGEWIFVERFHNNAKRGIKKFPSVHNAVDATDYADMQELMVAADILLSDYSSCMFDFMLSRKPVFIYAKDLDEYKTDDRGFYYPIESTPFPIARTAPELLENVSSFDFDKYIQGVELFLNERGCIEDGQASARVVKYITELIEDEKGKK